MKHIVTVFFTFLLCFVFLGSYFSFVSASSTSSGIHSSLPEPVPTDTVKYFVISDSTLVKQPLLFMISSPLQDVNFDVWVTPADNSIRFDVVTSSSQVGSNISFVHLSIFNAQTGAYAGYKQINLTDGYGIYSNFNLSGYDSIFCYGCDLINDNHFKASRIEWNNEETWAILNLLSTALSYIETKLGDILYNVENIQADVYDSLITLDSIDGTLSDFLSYIQNVYYPFFSGKITQINQKLTTIINLLGGNYTSTEFDQPSDQQQAIDDLASAEAAIRGDVQGDMANAFQDYGAVFNGNGAFAMIKTGFESLILNNVKLNALIIFALTLGIATLIIGRRIRS